jgi:shikimate kinase
MTDTRPRTIFLIGYRGTGKTTVARELAARLGWKWIDADDVVEQQAGKTIARIFAEHGESAFRDFETSAVTSLCMKTQAVVALGGGAVLREVNRQSINATAEPVVWLTATVDTILARVNADQSSSARRPNLTTAGGREEVDSLLVERMPLYRECATLVVDTDGKTATDVVEEILTRL